MTFQFAVYTDSLNGNRPLMVRLAGTLTAEQLAKFPKSFGFREGNRMYTWNLVANDANGGANEAAIKRLARMFKEMPDCYGENFKSANMMPEHEARKLAAI